MKDFKKKDELYLFLIILIILFSILTSIVALDYSKSFDKEISKSISGEPDNPLFESMRYITKMGSFYFLLPSSIAVIILLYYLKEHFISILYAVMMLIVVPAYRIVKYILGRQRPSIDFIHETGYSYPSGHTTGAFTFFVGLYVFYQILYKEEQNYLLLVICISLATLVGLSRIILGVHFLSDVIGGALLSGILITSFIIIHHLFKDEIGGKLESKLKNHD